MPLTAPPAVLKLLAHDLRWSLLLALSHSDSRVYELVTLLGEPVNLLSYHLKQLRAAGLVTAHRSEADGRDIYYSLNLDSLRQHLQAAGAALHPTLTPQPLSLPSDLPPLSVLFLCTHNSARSQMAEALLRHHTAGRLTVASAGAEPTTLHPEAIRVMHTFGLDLTTHHPKHWQSFAGQSFDVVITVCDRARESCPLFPAARQLHWSFPDPARLTNPAARRAAFASTAHQLEARIRHLLATLVHQPAA